MFHHTLRIVDGPGLSDAKVPVREIINPGPVIGRSMRRRSGSRADRWRIGPWLRPNGDACLLMRPSVSGGPIAGFILEFDGGSGSKS